MASFLNFEEENRNKLDTYEWTTVFNVEILTLVDDGYMELFTLIHAIGKVFFLALFMTFLAFRSYSATGERALFISIVPFAIMTPIIYSYLAMRFRGAEQARQNVVAASARLRHFAGECVLHYRMIADYQSRPAVLAQTMKLTQDLNKNLTIRSKRKANDGAFFGWLMKLIEFGAIVGLCGVVIGGGIRIGTFTAVLAGLKSAAMEFQGAYYTVMRMQACFPCLWKCVGYMNMPNDLWQRRDKLSEVRRWFADTVYAEESWNPGEIPEDKIPLSMGNITFAYKGGSSYVFRDLTVEFNQGEFVALVGPHNSGKNTLLQLLCGLLLPSAGSSRVPPHLRVLHLRYEPQVWDGPLSDTLYYGWMAAHGVARFEDLEEHIIAKGLDVCKQLELHQDVFDLIEQEARSRIDPSLATPRLVTDRTGLTTDSSYKLQLACALLAHPEVLVIHKPVAHATWTDGALVMDVLRRYVDERGVCVDSGLFHVRRPRTCIVSMEKPIFLEKVHRVFEVSGGQVREDRGWCHRHVEDAKRAGRPHKE
jgi:energy-coupling factor transporter ATP-binding protein EcfA2